MKTIGLLGGMSWESTAVYYRLINEGIKEKLGGLHSAKIILYSVDFGEIEQIQNDGDWSTISVILSKAAARTEACGADFLLICTNTMHKIAFEIESKLTMPLLHIVDVTADTIRLQGFHKVGLLGTTFTMEEDFYRRRLHERYGIEVLIPEPDDRKYVHAVIYNELCRGIINDQSRTRFLRIIENLTKKGAQSIILACTEIPLLINQTDTLIPLLDTTAIHAGKAVEYALAEE